MKLKTALVCGTIACSTLSLTVDAQFPFQASQTETKQAEKVILEQIETNTKIAEVLERCTTVRATRRNAQKLKDLTDRSNANAERIYGLNPMAMAASNMKYLSKMTQSIKKLDHAHTAFLANPELAKALEDEVGPLGYNQQMQQQPTPQQMAKQKEMVRKQFEALNIPSEMIKNIQPEMESAHRTPQETKAEAEEALKMLEKMAKSLKEDGSFAF